MPTAAGAVVFGVVVAACAAALGVVAGAGLLSPVVGGVALGFAAVVVVAELAHIARVPPSVGLVLAGTAAAVVVAFVEGVVEASLPAVVGGAGLGLLSSSWWRYAEHVIAVEGPRRALPAMAARWWVPARDLTLALAGRPLREPGPALPAVVRRR